MINSSYGSEQLRQEALDDLPDLTYGVANGLLIAIPLWVLIGAVLVFIFQEGSASETDSLAFMIAAVIETVLARYAFRSLWSKLPLRQIAARLQSMSAVAKSDGDSVAYLEKMTGRRIASIEDMLRVVAAPSAVRSERWPARVKAVQRSTLRNTASFAALAIAFLHYYFWDISLQITSLNSLIVFVTVPPLQMVAT